MISDKFEDVVSNLIAESAPMTRDQSVNALSNTKVVVEKLAQISDSLNGDKAGKGEFYKLDARYGIEPANTVFVYSNRPTIAVNVTGELTADFMYQKPKDSELRYSDDLVEVLGGTGVTSIGKNCFNGLTTLKTAIFKNVTTVGQGAFANCTALADVNIENCTDLGASAFMACSSIEEINIPKVKSLKDKVFLDCINLKRMNIEGCDSIASSTILCNGGMTADFKLEYVNFGAARTTVPSIVSNAHRNFANADIIIPFALYDEWRSKDVWKLLPNVGATLIPYNKRRQLRQQDLDNKLSMITKSLEDISTIGDSDYGIEDIKDRVDSIIQALKSL